MFHFQIALVVLNQPSEKQIEEAFIPLAKANGINITSLPDLPGDYLSKNNGMIENIIESTYEKIRSKCMKLSSSCSSFPFKCKDLLDGLLLLLSLLAEKSYL